MKLYDCPEVSLEESKRVPESEVTVCGALSLLVHVTFVPVLIEIEAGLNAKSLIPTATEAGTDGEGWAVCSY